MIKQEDFDAWRAHPVTEAVFAEIRAIRDKARADWNHVSWESERIWRDGQAQYMRTACRARAECAEDILNLTFEEEEDNEQRDHPD